MNKLLAKTDYKNINNTPRKSITRQYTRPKPPLHATEEIINENEHNFDDIVKNNPYQSKKIKSNPKKRIIRPINAKTQYNNYNNNDHTIVAMNHHRKESKAIDVFLRNRTPESELKNRQILPSNVQSNYYDNHTQQFWEKKQKEKDKIKHNLNQKLSDKFRPQQQELYNRGIYVTDPKVIFLYNHSLLFSLFHFE